MKKVKKSKKSKQIQDSSGDLKSVFNIREKMKGELYVRVPSKKQKAGLSIAWQIQSAKED